MKFTWQKVFVFMGIIALGIIGLIVADQYDFLGGRTDDSINIGTGSVEKIEQPFQLKIDPSDDTKRDSRTSNSRL